MKGRRAGPFVVGVLWAGPLAFVAAGFGLIGKSTLVWLWTWGTSYLFLLGALVCSARALGSSRDRGAWIAMTLAALCWTFGNFYYAFAYSPAPAPGLSWSDGGYLAFPLFFAVGALKYAHVRLPRVPVAVWLDAGIVALGSSAVIAAVIFAGVSVHVDSFTSVVGTICYPAEDIVVAGLMVGAGSVLGWRLGASGALMGAAITCITVSDVLALTEVLQGSAYGDAWTNAGWSAGIALIAAAAIATARGPRRRPVPQEAAIAVPILAAVAALGVVILAVPLGLHPIALGLACATIAAVIVRLTLAVRDIQSLYDNRRLALTDDLTGLPNRRRLLRDLADACASSTPYELTLLDLDGFKHFNDFHGHSAGDELLASLASALGASLPAGGRAYRLGGDEFCTLVPAVAAEGSQERDGAGKDAVAALTAAGRNWSVAPSWGSVRLSEEANDPASALSLADRRMYEQKRRRPGSARHQVRDALLLALGEQQPLLRTHVQGVTDQVERLARQLGMSDAEIDDAVRAAELHDIGKLAIPASILEKPGPLDDNERAVIRTHTIVGERMLLAAPALQSVAPLVRASHERWDGDGYPDGLAGETIPLGARIVSVCDSFDAMIADRPYRPARTPDQALAELRRCAGTQFDPGVVDAFTELLGSQRLG